jgi:hypothetical protein
MSLRFDLPLSTRSLVVTALVAGWLGALSVLLSPQAGRTVGAAQAEEQEPPAASAILRCLDEHPSAASPLRLELSVRNEGSQPLLAPLDGSVALAILEGPTGPADPEEVAFAIPCTGGFSTCPATIDPGATTRMELLLPGRAPFDRPGRYALSGSLVSAAGVVPLPPLVIDLAPAPTLAQALPPEATRR